MINYFDEDNDAGLFVQYLNHLIYDHYSVIYPKRKNNTLWDPVYRVNEILGTLAYACALRRDYPERGIGNCSIEAIRQLPPAKDIYEEWRNLSVEGIVIAFCEKIDDYVYSLAKEQGQFGLCVRCPIILRRTEIVEKLFYEASRLNKEKTSNTSSKITEI